MMINNQAQRSLSLLRSQLRRPFSHPSLSPPFSIHDSFSPISSNPSLKTPFSPFSHTPSLRKKSNEEEHNRDPESPPRLLVVQPRLRPNALMQAKLSEALNLANSLEEQRDGYFITDLSQKQSPPHVVVQNPLTGSSKGHADTYFGQGTVENIKIQINAAESEGELDAVFVNAILTAIQQRNLERVLGKPVLDRVGLIIEIFNAHAYTKEAKLQAELAALMYKKTRLVRVRGPDGRYTFGSLGEAEVVSARGRGSGGRGFISGAGETELELQRRRISERRKRLLAEIEDVRRTRAVQRAARRTHGASDSLGLATVAIVGYTNAGKSTLVSTLSDSDLYSDDRLFATVDPRIRGVTLPSGRKVLLSDTVGFISDLPVQLVEAFHATLEEVVEADLLVHVLDSSAPDIDDQRKAVVDVLQQIGVSEKKIQDTIEVWNKIDLEGENFGDEYDDNFDDDQLSDYSDGWLERGIDEESEEEQVYTSMGWTTSDDQKRESMDESKIEGKVSDSNFCSENSDKIGKIIKHVKTSAVTGVGLQELLELIDEKLVQIEEERRGSKRVVERSEFDRKWRPPRTDDADIAVGQ